MVNRVVGASWDAMHVNIKELFPHRQVPKRERPVFSQLRPLRGGAPGEVGVVDVGHPVAASDQA